MDQKCAVSICADKRLWEIVDRMLTRKKLNAADTMKPAKAACKNMSFLTNTIISYTSRIRILPPLAINKSY